LPDTPLSLRNTLYLFTLAERFLYGVDKAILLITSQKGGQYGNDRSAEIYPAFGPHLPENGSTNSLTEHMTEASNSE
jgi:hypothetical protein